MKVLHIETGRHLYGGALQVCYLLEGLAQQGVNNILVCTAGSEIAQAAATYASIVEVPMGGDLDLLFPFRLSRLIRKYQPNVVHVHSRRGADLWAGVCARLQGIPAVVTRRVDNREWSPFARWKYGTYDRVVTISEGIRQVLLSEGLAPDRVQCVHSVVRAENYQVPRDRDWFSKEFGIPADALVIGVIAQLIPRKGHRYLLESVPDLLTHFPSLRIVFFGQGPLQEELSTYISNHNLTGSVLFGGFRRDMPQILPNLDLVVHPALMEGLGVSLLQAAAAGVPIVGARAGGIPEIVHDGVNGYLVEPGDIQTLLQAITRLLDDPSQAEQLGQAGKRIVAEHFSVGRMVQSYQHLYHDVASPPRRL